MKKLMLMATIAISLSSCMTTKTSVANYKESEGKTYVYSKGKQVWLFWGLVPMGRTSVSTPVNGSCQVITRFGILDNIVSLLTGGIVITETIKVKAKKEEK